MGLAYVYLIFIAYYCEVSMNYVKSAGIIITTPLTSTSDFSVLHSNGVPQSVTQSSRYGRNGTISGKDTLTMYSSMLSLTSQTVTGNSTQELSNILSSYIATEKSSNNVLNVNSPMKTISDLSVTPIAVRSSAITLAKTKDINTSSILGTYPSAIETEAWSSSMYKFTSVARLVSNTSYLKLHSLHNYKSTYQSTAVTILVSASSSSDSQHLNTINLSTETNVLRSNISSVPYDASYNTSYQSTKVNVLVSSVSGSAYFIPSIVPNYNTTIKFTGVTVSSISNTPYLVSPSLPMYNTPLRRPVRITPGHRQNNLSCGQVLQLVPDTLTITEHQNGQQSISGTISRGHWIESSCEFVGISRPKNSVMQRLQTDRNLVTMMHSKTVQNISVGVTYPENIKTILNKHFSIQKVNNYTSSLHLETPVDIEQIYLDTKTVIKNILLTMTCFEQNTRSLKTVNITVEDIDDNGPSFEHSDTSQCALPVYSAGTGEQFVGIVHLTPGAIHAVDGDLVKTNNISYSFLHGDPVNYYNYFIIDYTSGTVNKTSNITDVDPHNFVIIIQATEDSPIKRSSVAVLTVYVSPPYTPAINNPYRANRTVITVLQILSVIVILSFTAGFVYIARHRNMKHKVANLKENAEKNDTIDDIEEFMVATSTNEVMTCAQPVLASPEPGPVLLSVPSPDPIPTTSQSPISTRKVTFDLPEKTYKMIYGTKGRRNRKP